MSVPIIDEVVNGNWRPKKDIVVEIDELFRQTLDSMEVMLNGVAVKGWEVRRRVLKDFLVSDQVNSAAGCVQPVRHLPVGHQMKFAHPWGKLDDRSHGIFQSAPIKEPSWACSICDRAIAKLFNLKQKNTFLVIQESLNKLSFHSPYQNVTIIVGCIVLKVK